MEDDKIKELEAKINYLTKIVKALESANERLQKHYTDLYHEHQKCEGK